MERDRQIRTKRNIEKVVKKERKWFESIMWKLHSGDVNHHNHKKKKTPLSESKKKTYMIPNSDPLNNFPPTDLAFHIARSIAILRKLLVYSKRRTVRLVYFA